MSTNKDETMPIFEDTTFTGDQDSNVVSKLIPQYKQSDIEKEIASILRELATSDRELTQREKSWYTEKFKEMRAHHRNDYLMRAIIEDDDLFYKLLFLGGGGMVILGAALSIGLPTDFGDHLLRQPMTVAGLVFIPSGITVMIFAGIMLAIPRLFGENGMQFEASGNLGSSVFGGLEGELKVG